jgi:hypothetical protein
MCSNLRHYPGICLEGLSKTTKTLSHYIRYPGRYLHSESPEYEAEVLIKSTKFSIHLQVITFKSKSKTNCPLSLKFGSKMEVKVLKMLESDESPLAFKTVYMSLYWSFL